MKALNSYLSKKSKLKKLTVASIRPVKSVGKTKSVMPIRAKVSNLKTKVAK